MKIEKILEQHRRDFRAIFVCEHCDFQVEKGGYDDTNYHNNVIPNMICPKCKRSAPNNYRLLSTKYPDSAII